MKSGVAGAGANMHPLFCTLSTYGIPIEIGACGEMNLAVSDSGKLLLKLR